MASGWSVRLAKQAEPVWHRVDAKGEVVGRLAAQVARLLVGKHKPTYVPHIPCGDKVVVVNAAEVRFTGRKETDKRYYWHTGYPGGIRHTSPSALLASHPERVLQKAVSGMLPKNKLRRVRMSNLHVFPDASHPFEAQLERSADQFGSFVRQNAPQSKTIQVARQAIDLVEDAFPGVVDEEEWDENLWLQDQGAGVSDLGERFEVLWEQEIQHWANLSQPVPLHIYQLHDIPYPGPSNPPLSPKEARKHFEAAFRKAEVKAGFKEDERG